MSDDIEVYTTAATRAGRLYPRFVRPGILTAESRVARDWTCGISVGNLICDADSERKLTCIEYSCLKKFWRVRDDLPELTETKKKDLHFAEATLKKQDFDDCVEVFATRGRGIAMIFVGGGQVFRSAIELSSGCHALLDGSRLVGFRIAVP